GVQAASRPQPVADRGRDPARDRRQSVPLYRLSAHRQRRARRRGQGRSVTAMATTITKTEKLSGKRIRRKEDPRLITGTATYVDDIKMPGMHHACIVRSPHAAARIRSINTQPALGRPGVAAVFTGADVETVGPVPCGASLPGLRVPHHAILPRA